MIGLSLSFCVKDIALGRVVEADVIEIRAGTKFTDDQGFEEVLDCYRLTYWLRLPEAVNIARRLYGQGKITQARLTGGEAPNIVQGWWIE